MIAFFLYFSLLLFLSLRYARRSTNRDDFYVCGRKASSSLVAFSIVASCVGGSATLGMTGLARDVGMPAFWWLGSGAVGLVVLSLFLARKVRQSGAATMPEMLTTYLGAFVRPLASVIIVTAWMAILAAQFSALAAIIMSLTNFGQISSLLLGVSGLTAYTLAGGQAAVMRSDVWQFGVLATALVLGLVAACVVADGAGARALAAAPFEMVNAGFTAEKLRYYLCILGGSYIVCPMLFARLLSARDAATARRGCLWAAFGLAIMAVVITMLGIACRGLVSPEIPAERVLGEAFSQHLPVWASTLILLGIFSAIISSADSCLMTAASVCCNDILRKPGVAACRICMPVLACVGLILALSGKGILPLLLMANDIFVCGVVAPVFVGMVLYKRVCFNPSMAAVAMAVGGAFGLTSALTGENMYSFLGLGCSLALTLLAARTYDHSVDGGGTSGSPRKISRVAAASASSATSIIFSSNSNK